MATPTEGEVQTQWSNAVMLIEKLWQTGRTAGGNIIGRLDTLVQSLESDFAPNILDEGQAVRNSLATIIGQAANLQLPNIQSYLKHIFNYYNLTDVPDMLDQLYDEFAKSTQRVKSRVFSFSNPTIWTVDYACTVEPDAATPVWVLTGTDESSVAAGILTIDTALAGGAAICRYDRSGLSFDNTKGWTIETKMKVTTSAAADTRLNIQISDGAYVENIAFSTAQIKLLNDAGTYAIDTTDDFHIYRIVGKGTVIKVYVDGILRITGTLSNPTGNNHIFFGDGNNAGGANNKSEWDYVRYYLNEIRTGTGSIIRLNKDRNNFDIENQHADTKIAKCITDVSGGANKWEEVFTFEGEDAGIDDLDRIGSGLIKQIAAKSANDSLLLNPSFSGFGGTAIATPSEITSWTSDVAYAGDGSDYVIVETDYYRDFAGDPTPRSLKIKLARTLSQKLSLRATVLDSKTPYLMQIAWKRPGTGTGTLTIHMGGQTVNVAVVAQSGWQILRIAVDTNLWPLNFRELDTEIKVQWAPSGGDNEILVDDFLFIPMDEFDGSWYSIVPNEAEPVNFLEGDKFTWTDTETGSINQYWLFRGHNKYLPHSTAGGVTWADPT